MTLQTMEEYGGYLWVTLHRVARWMGPKPTPDQLRAAKDLAYSYLYLIPCTTCAEDWRAILEKELPPVFTTGEEFWRWTVDAHNLVNRKLGKPTYTYEQAAFMLDNNPYALGNNINHHYGKKSFSRHDMYILIGLLVVFLLLILAIVCWRAFMNRPVTVLDGKGIYSYEVSGNHHHQKNVGSNGPLPVPRFEPRTPTPPLTRSTAQSFLGNVNANVNNNNNNNKQPVNELPILMPPSLSNAANRRPSANRPVLSVNSIARPLVMT